MNELQALITQEPGVIHFNFEDLKAQLSKKMEIYQGAVFTEEHKSTAKAELASLRKLKESVDKRRKEVKVQAMQPYMEFERQVKELIAIIDEPIALIDRQLKEMEEVRIQKRREEVRILWDKCIGELSEVLPLEKIYDKKWDNATTSMKNIEKDLIVLIEKTNQEISIIRNSQSDVMEDALELYKKSLDLTGALTHINTYEANKRKALELEEEKRRLEEDRRRQEEIERAKAEERQKLAEIEAARAEERRMAADAFELSSEESEKTPFSTCDEADSLPFEQPTTITAFYKVVASRDELEQVEMAFNSIGIYFERRDA